MSKTIAVLMVVCLLLSGMMNSAYAAKIQSTELSPAEAEALAQAQAASAQTIDTTAGTSAVVGALAIIGAVAVILIIIAAAK
jgi:hypothetical protein